MPEIKPWSRQIGETSKAYAAFVCYRDLGTARTLRRVALELDRSFQLISKWSSEHDWPERARAWDSIPGEAVADAHAAMAARIAAQHEEVATKLLAKLSRNVDMLPEGADPTIRFSTALGAARQSHQFATELGRPKDDTKAEITKAIEALVRKLAGHEE